MSTPLFEWAPPDGTEVLIQWLKPLGEVRDERPNDGALPFRMVHNLGGPSDRLVDKSTYSVHTFAVTKAEAQAEAMITHRRILKLAGQFAGQEKVTLADGQVVQADDVAVIETPRWVQWVEDNSINRYVATYRLELRFTAAI